MAHHTYKAVHVLSVELESIKELTRVRASAAGAKKRAKQNLLSFLLQKGMGYPFGGRTKYWTQQFYAWLKTLEFAHPLDRYSFEEYLTEVNHQVGRVALLNEKFVSLGVFAANRNRTLVKREGKTLLALIPTLLDLHSDTGRLALQPFNPLDATL